MLYILFLLSILIVADSFKPLSILKKSYPVAREINMEWDFKELKSGTDDRMKKSIEACQNQLNTIRAGGANPGILDRIQVEYYGTYTPLQQVARVAAQGAEMLVIEPFDKSIIKDIEREISQSDLNLTPTNDGSGIIRISIPPLTADRRKELAKQAKSVGEEGKVAVRNVRRDAVDTVKKAEKSSDCSKDDSAGAQQEIQDLTDKYVKKIDDLVKSKEAALTKI